MACAWYQMWALTVVGAMWTWKIWVNQNIKLALSFLKHQLFSFTHLINFPILLFLYLIPDSYAHCRWSTNACEPLLFIKHGTRKLNILDAEKKALTLKFSIMLSYCNFSKSWNMLSFPEKEVTGFTFLLNFKDILSLH